MMMMIMISSNADFVTMLKITNTYKDIPGHFLLCSLQLLDININYKDENVNSKLPSWCGV